MSRKTIDYYKNGQHILRIGKVNYEKAHKPLETHIHPNQMEVTVIVKGIQIYQADETEYEIKSGELFLTYPNEEHGSANNPEDKAEFYYLIFDIEKLIEQRYLCEDGDREVLQNAWKAEKQHLMKGSKKIQEYCKSLMEVCSSDSPMKHTLIRNYLSLLVIEIFAIRKKEPDNEEEGLTSILEYIQQNIRESITLEELAELYGVSLSRFKSLFRKKGGNAPERIHTA